MAEEDRRWVFIWPAMPEDIPERRFVILKMVGKTPAMAGCTACQRKFFTPQEFARDEFAATQYLIDKFDRHTCQARPPKKPSTPTPRK
jgi:hypothetical protein